MEEEEIEIEFQKQCWQCGYFARSEYGPGQCTLQERFTEYDDPACDFWDGIGWED